MRTIEYPTVYHALYVLLMTAVIAVISAGETLPVFMFKVLFWGVIYGAGLWCGWRYRKKRPKVIKIVAYLFLGLSLLVFYGVSRSGGIERSFLAFLICIQGARNFTLSNRRDLYFAFLVSLILIVYAASVSKETSFLFYLVIYVLAGVYALMADHVDEKLFQARGGDKAILSRKINLPVKGGGFAVSILLVALVVYLFIPRLPSPHFRAFPSRNERYYSTTELGKGPGETTGRQRRGPGKQPSDPSGSGSDYEGFGKRFDVEAVGKALETPLFHLKADRPIYARGKSFDTFDGRFWENSESEMEKLTSEEGQFILDGTYRGEGTDQIYYIEKDIPPVIFSAYRPVVLWFPSVVVGKDISFSLWPPGYLRQGTIYSILSEVKDIEGRPSGGKEDCQQTERYLQLPPALSPRVRELSFTITDGIPETYEKTKAVEQYLRTRYQYTPEPVQRERDEDKIVQFLFESKKGHCSYFASSMVLLLRTSGIPSRVATGYRATRYNPFTGYYQIVQKDAHAWVEAYFEDYGWVTFEPTPGFRLPPQRRRYFVFQGIIEYLKDLLRSLIQTHPEKWWIKVIQMIVMFLKNLWVGICQFWTMIKAALGDLWDWFKGIGWVVFILATLAAGLVYRIWPVLSLMYRKWRLQRIRANDSTQFVLECYKEMERFFSEKGLPRPVHHSPEEYRESLRLRFNEVSRQVGTITVLFQQARYGRHSMSDENGEEAFKAYEGILKLIRKRRT